MVVKFVSAACARDAVAPALVAIWVTVLGLSAVNLSNALEIVLAGRSTVIYWAEIALLALYALCLTIFWLQSGLAAE